MIASRRAIGLTSAISAIFILLSITVSPVASASQTDCLSYGYACTSGYDATNAQGTWAWAHYGGSYALNANGYHNCTLYAAWRLEQNGMSDPGNWGNAVDWKSHTSYNHTPKVGSIAWWGSEVAGGYGHVAYVDQVNGSQVHVIADNYVGPSSDGYTSSGWIPASSVDEFLHPHDLPSGGNPPPPSSAGPISALVHGSRVNLSWGAASGASLYQVSRDGVLLATVSGTEYLDIQVSPKQAYTYSVAALNSSGMSAPVTLYVQTTVEAADRAYLPTKNGPAICGRAGDQSSQYLVCNVNTPTGWTTSYSKPDDWGYATDRSWIANPDGTVSYCRRVGTGDQALCDHFDGTTWTQSMSPHYDFGYDQNRAYLPTKNGPAICGRAGDQSSQYLVCNVNTPTGWTTSYSKPDDWGYATDRSWIANPDGTVSYCRRVGTGDQALCDHFDGTTWTQSMSPHYDFGYDQNRAYLPTKNGPAICGRAGDQSSQYLVCNVNTPTGWTTSYSKPDDWGYATDRSWIANPDGTVSYCRRVGTGDQALCDHFDGTTWTQSMSPHYDFGYDQNRAYLPTKNGPAICGRAGDQSSQYLVCNVNTPTGWTTSYSKPDDWGYATDRSWIANPDGTVSYCRRVGTGDQALCDHFDGTTWTQSMSPHYDFGYPDTFG